VKDDQYLNTNDFLDAVKEEFDRHWSKWTERLTGASVPRPISQFCWDFGFQNIPG